MILTFLSEGKEQEARVFLIKVLGKYFDQSNFTENYANKFPKGVAELMKSLDPPEYMIERGAGYQSKYCTDECLKIKKR